MQTYWLMGWLLAVIALAAPAWAEQLLLDFEAGFDLSTVATSDAQVQLVPHAGGQALRVDSGHAAEWPGIALKPERDVWELSRYEYVALDVTNVGANRVTVFCRVDSPGADGVRNCVTDRLELPPGESGTLRVTLTRKLPPQVGRKLFGMRGYPGGMDPERGVDARNINQILVFVARPQEDHQFILDNLRADGDWQPPVGILVEEEQFFPFIDTFGQYLHADWPGKTHSVEDMRRAARQEAADLQVHPGPEGWDQYGGWAAGPQLEATGFFRAEKVGGKWWLVDPEGRLFWSHGIDCVHEGNATTPITDRESYFADLPPEDSPLARFYGSSNWAPHGYYQGKGEYRTFNFTAANLLRKYGEGWQAQFDELAHHRLRSWGMNTIANWSSERIYLMRRTPYVVSVHFGGRLLEGSEGYWGKFRDVFDPSFRDAVRRAMAWQKGRSAGDPWCIGYFVDNEIAWGDELSLAVAALLSPADQPAKLAFVEDLKAKYGTIGRLNQTWGTGHASWEALLQSREAPDREKAYEDLAAFYDRTAEMYFATCRAAVKEVAPDNLYLGCRFAWVNPRAVRAAARYCDVVSYNLYTRSVADFRLPDDLDLPVIIGEFHFGALDRGLFHTGLVPCASQEERAGACRAYLLGALRNPLFVGAHWFQFGDQATTGRGDGENYQIGFLDVADTPYPETIAACREVGYRLYEYRSGGD